MNATVSESAPGRSLQQNHQLLLPEPLALVKERRQAITDQKMCHPPQPQRAVWTEADFRLRSGSTLL